MKKDTWIFIFYLIVGLLVINTGLGLIDFPDFLGFLNKWIALIGGILVIFSGLKYAGLKN